MPVVALPCLALPSAKASRILATQFSLASSPCKKLNLYRHPAIAIAIAIAIAERLKVQESLHPATIAGPKLIDAQTVRLTRTSATPHQPSPPATATATNSNVVPPYSVPHVSLVARRIDNQRHLFLPTAQKLDSRTLFALRVPSQLCLLTSPQKSIILAERFSTTQFHDLTLRQIAGFQRFLAHWSIAVCRSILPLLSIGPAGFSIIFGPCIEAVRNSSNA